MAGKAETIGDVTAEREDPTAVGGWRKIAYLGKEKPIFQGNTTETYKKGTRLKIRIRADITALGQTKPQYSEPKDYTVP